MGARLGGDNITTHLVPLSTGIDMVEACIKIALGENPTISKKIDKGSAIRYFNSKKGMISSIDGIDKAKSIKGVIQISIIHDIGEKINDIMNSNDRIGFVIAQGKTVEEAINICEQALKEISIDISEY